MTRRELLAGGIRCGGLLWLAGCSQSTDGGDDAASASTPRSARGARAPETERYGPGDRQYGEWTWPAGAQAGSALPVVVLLHGGYWRVDFGLDLEREVAAELGRRGFAVWNADYSAADLPWPATFDDAAAALDHLRTTRHADRVDLDRVGVVGHSAGGHLALWLASRAGLPAGAPGEPGADSVAVQVVVAQAPVADLLAAARQNLGGGAAQDLLDGSPDEVPERYAAGSPQALLPVRGVRLVLVHGTADDVVPLAQSRRYAAEAGPGADLVVLEGVGHFEHLDPASPALRPVYEALAAL